VLVILEYILRLDSELLRGRWVVFILLTNIEC